MSGVQIRQVGTTATYAAVIKRGVATLSDGRVVALVIDTNLAASSGTDVTGVAKIHLYVSTDSSRTAWTLATSLTPAVAPSSSTRAARASMSIAADNSVWVAWQGVDNAIYCSRWSYSAGALTFVATETVAAATGTTDRYRAIDIDLAGNSTALIAGYSAVGSTSATHVFLRNTVANWILVVSSTSLASGQTARVGSEDISVAWRGDGIVSNLGNFLVYHTKVSTTADFGDRIREFQVNNTTTTASSATLQGTWLADAAFQNQASGTRRAMIYTISNTVWILAGVIGAGIPKFFATKLTSGNYTNPVISTAGYVTTTALANYFQIDASANTRTYWTTAYRDNRLLFVFAGYGTGTSPRQIREVSMVWSSVGSVTAAPTVDLVPRPSDSAYYGDGGPISIYGGDNERLQVGLKTYNYVGVYGPGGVTISTTIPRRVRFISEDVYDAPMLLTPNAVEPTSRPTYRVTVQNNNLQPNLYGKIEVNVAPNSAFSSGVISIIEPDANFRYYGSKDGLSGGSTTVAVSTPGPGQALTQGTWYWRARVIADKGPVGAWSTTQSFSVSHAPTATPTYPTPNAIIPYTSTNNYPFSWLRSDTEPFDTQTAYRIIIRRLDTLASIYDSGFISSSITSATLSYDFQGNSLVEAPLDWSVQLKDQDGVTGPASTPVQFVVGYQPALSILSPNSVDDLTTAMPSITWGETFYGGRTQSKFRISIYDNTNPNLIPANPSFELGSLSGWTTGGGTASASSTQKHSGNWSGFMTPDGTTVTPNFQATTKMAVTAGKNYVAEGWIYLNGSVAKPPVVGFNWYDSGGTFISNTGNYFEMNPVGGAWMKLSSTAQAPPGAAQANLFFGRGFTPAVTDTFNVDDIGFYQASTFDTDPIFTTGWVSSTATTYTPPVQAFVNNSNYRIVLEVQDSGGLITLQNLAVHTNWVEPALAGGVSVTAYDDFKVRITWTNASQDADWVAYRIYRRYMQVSDPSLDINDTANTWYLLYETQDSLTSYAFDDYLAPLNKSIEYVVVQLADRFGSLIESNITSTFAVTLVGERYFFVPAVPVGTIASFEATGVTGDDFTRDIEQETLHVIGRGRQVQIGDDLGYSGTLTIKLRNAATVRRDREFFELISSTYNKVYIKSPFGDVVLIALGPVQTGRQAGYGGYADFSDLSLPYTEIIDEELTVRQV